MAGMSRDLARIGFANARRLLLLAGLALLGVLTVTLLVRSVDQVEVWATLLYVPILLGLLFFGVRGGVLAAVAATAVYVGLRADAVDAVGTGEFAGLIVSRGLAYLLFGAVGGWASATLELSLDKLDLHDEIDDQTGIRNARSLRRAIDLERSRAVRYRTLFSVVFLEFPAGALEPIRGRRRRNVLRDLGRRLEDSVRTVDCVAHGFDGRTHLLAAVLPETAGAGAAVFQQRFVDRVKGFLLDEGADDATDFTARSCTVPGDEARLEALLERWPAVDGATPASVPA